MPGVESGVAKAEEERPRGKPAGAKEPMGIPRKGAKVCEDTEGKERVLGPRQDARGPCSRATWAPRGATLGPDLLRSQLPAKVAGTTEVPRGRRA